MLSTFEVSLSALFVYCYEWFYSLLKGVPAVLRSRRVDLIIADCHSV